MSETKDAKVIKYWIESRVRLELPEGDRQFGR